MARRPEPWKRKGSGGAWYATVRGVQVRLADPGASKTDAARELAKVLARDEVKPKRPDAGPTVRVVLAGFLEAVEGRVARGEIERVTLVGYDRYLVTACASIGEKAAEGLKVGEVTGWLDARKRWGATSRFNAVTAIKAAFSWANEAGVIGGNPIARMKRPRPERRELVITWAQSDEILDAIRDREFRDLVWAIRETGCRPGEVMGLAASGVDLKAGVWRVGNKTGHATGEAMREVYLTDAAVELSRRLCERWPSGPIFRNVAGTGWTRHLTAHRMGRLKARLGLAEGLTLYSLRHLYITDALEKGVPPATVAQLVGHSDLTMIMRIYNRLRERTGHLREAARVVRSA